MGMDTTTYIVAIAAGCGVVSAILYFMSLKRGPVKFLQNPETKYDVKLIEKESLSHDTRRFRFALPTNEHILGLPVGQHIYLNATINGQLVIRPYTPVTSDDDKGHFDLVIKVYFGGVNPKFPDGGKMSQHLESLKIGDSILIRGPSGNIIYEAPGTFSVRKNKTSAPNKVKCTKIGMIAGGTGLTPMYQLIKDVLKNPKDSSKLWLLLANQSEDDILLRNELEQLQKENPDRFSLWFTVDRSTPGWKYDVGFVSADMIQARLPSPAADTVILLCGPPPMINFACNPNLDKLGHQPTNRFTF